MWRSDNDRWAGWTGPCDRQVYAPSPYTTMAADGGWWSLALRDPAYATALRGVPMSRSDTYAATREALNRAGLSVASAPVLRDVDTAADALEVANDCPAGQFADAVRRHVVTTNRPQAEGLRFATLLARAHVAVRR